MKNILDFDINDLKNCMKENGEKEFRASQIFDWIYKDCFEFDQMRNLPESLRRKLKEMFYVGIPQVAERHKSQDSETNKFLFRYMDGNTIETVVMHYKHGNSICVSTQFGCRMGCSFCASTVNGMVRNMTCGEILGQILAAKKAIGERISNIVLMGTGEPLDNFENVLKFIDLANAEYGLNIGQRHITLSTCGLVPQIIRLADLNYQITLAVSLHAPNDKIRSEMMPIAKKYSIDEILNACRYYIDKTNRRITFEYALIKGKNDSPENASELAAILKGMLCHVNLIPVNTVVEKGFSKPSQEEITTFSSILAKRGIESTVRREMGSDINAACGQLRRSYLKDQRSE
ncbi:MAG: 23S rRNA (adenine(2503)-C(2))-methyltransferase RlmN [Clostridiaceae bacterium]